MANFSGEPLLSARVDIRVEDKTLQRDLDKAKQAVQKTTDEMTKMSINKMKDRARANLRLNKMEQQETVRTSQKRVKADKEAVRSQNKLAATRRKAAKEQKSSSNNAAKQSAEARNRVGRLSSAFRMLGVQVTILGAIITAVFAKMVKDAKEFDTAMRKATAVSTTSLAQYSQMASMAERQSITLNMAATDTADAFYFLGSAGLNAEQQMKAFIPVVTLAKAAVIEAGQAAEIMVDTMKGFKIPFEEAAHVAAVLAKSVISSNMNFLQLGETLSLVAGVARTTNNSLEDTAAMIQVMANVGIKGTRAGTTLRRSMLNLAAPSSKITKLFDGLNIEITNQQDVIKPYIQLVGELGNALHDAGEDQKAMAFKTLFGARAIAGQLEIFDAGATKLRRMSLELRLVGNTHKEIADKQLKAFGEQVGQMQRAFENLNRHLTSKFVPTIKLVTSWIEKLTKKMTKAADEGDELSGVIVGTGIAMGGILTVAGAGLTTLASLALVSSGLTIGFGALVGISVGVIAAITAIIAVVVKLINKYARAKEFQMNLNKEIDNGREIVKQSRKEYENWAAALGDIKPTKEFLDLGKQFLKTSDDIDVMNNKLNLSNKILNNANMTGPQITKILKKHGMEPTTRTVISRQPLVSSFGVSAPTTTTTTEVDIKTSMKRLITKQKAEMEEIKKHQAEILTQRALLEDQLFDIDRKGKVARGELAKAWRVESVQIAVDMYSDIKNSAAAAHQFQIQLIDERQKAELMAFKKREILASEDKALAVLQFKFIQDLQKKALINELRMQRALQGDDFGAGFKAQMRENIENMKKLGTVGAETADTLKDSFADVLGDLTRDIRNWRNIFLDAIMAIENALIDLATQQVALQIFDKARDSKAGGGLLALGSSLLGAIKGPTSGAIDLSGNSAQFGGAVTAARLSAATPLHAGGHAGSSRLDRGGLGNEEFNATLLSGERVLRRGDKANKSDRGDNTPVMITMNISAIDTKSLIGAMKPIKKELTSMVQSASRDNHPIRRS